MLVVYLRRSPGWIGAVKIGRSNHLNPTVYGPDLVGLRQYQPRDLSYCWEFDLLNPEARRPWYYSAFLEIVKRWGHKGQGASELVRIERSQESKQQQASAGCRSWEVFGYHSTVDSPFG